jgi:glycosyltransferase involved in cell wall biosynthesis
MERLMEALRDSPITEQVQLRCVNTGGPAWLVGSRLGKDLNVRRVAANLGRLFRREPIALMHLHLAWGPSFMRGLPLAEVAFRHGIPTVIHLQSGRTKVFWDALEGAERKSLYRMLERLAGISVLSRSWMVELYDYAPRKRWYVIPNCADTEAFACPDRRPADPSRPFQWVFTGRFEQPKGTSEMAAAMAALGGRAELHCYGRYVGDESEARFNDAIARGAHIHIHHEAPSSEIRAALCRADGFLFPTHVEGLPVSLVEAMAAGLPVVTTPVGAIPDMLDGLPGNPIVPVGFTNGLIAAMRGVMAHPAAAYATGQRNASRARERYSIAALAETTWNCYRDVIERTANLESSK